MEDENKYLLFKLELGVDPNWDEFFINNPEVDCIWEVLYIDESKVRAYNLKLCMSGAPMELIGYSSLSDEKIKKDIKDILLQGLNGTLGVNN